MYIISRFDPTQAQKAHGGTILASAVLPAGLHSPFDHAWGYLNGPGAMEPYIHHKEEIYIFTKGYGFVVVDEVFYRGIAAEALKEAVKFIFENTEIERLNGRADVRNMASNKVLQRCGFIKEGTIRQGKMVSVYCDYNIYGMLREDYASRNET